MHNTIHSTSGFSLIELMVVITLTIILTIAGMGLFFSSLYGNSKKAVLTVVKDEGDYALSQIEFLLRNSIQLVQDPADASAPICAPGMSKISFRSFDNNITTLTSSGGKIASKSASAAQPVFLTTDSVLLSTPPRFDCSQVAQNSGGYVKISFSLQKQGDSLGNPSPLLEDFVTSVQLRNN
jgi:type II secretory pathway pseudopilin PulG